MPVRAETEYTNLALQGGGATAAPHIVNLKAGAALAKNRFVVLGDGGTEAHVAYPASTGVRAFGVTLAAAASGAQVPVQVAGLATIELSGAITAPANLAAVTTTGKGQAATSGQVASAYLLQDAAADGNLRLCLLLTGGSFTV